MENQRVRLTKKLLTDAFIDLLEVNKIEKISIHQLSIKAGVNRSTFYLHYTDIYHFLQEIELNLVNDIKEYIEVSKHESDSNITNLLEYIESNKRIFRVLLIKCESSRFNEKFLKISSDILETGLMVSQDHRFKAYIIEYLLKANNALIFKWIHDDFKLSVSDLTLIMRNLSHGVVNSIETLI